MADEESGPNISGVRDQKLLDALEQLPQRPYSGKVWRSVKEGRDPLACWRSGGRWDDKTFDVLYTSETKQGAIEERRFHLFMGQPIPPSKIRYELFEIEVSLEAVIHLPDLSQLAELGLSIDAFGKLSYFEKESEYPRSQEIAEVCNFLGADGILVPSARDDSTLNLVIFCEQTTNIEKEVSMSHGVIDWKKS